MTPSGKRVCKVCGIEYPYCTTVTKDKYRWQDVACCKEHAAQYFAEVAMARGEVYHDVFGDKQSVDVKTEEPVVDGEAPIQSIDKKTNTAVKTQKKKRNYKGNKSEEI